MCYLSKTGVRALLLFLFLAVTNLSLSAQTVQDSLNNESTRRYGHRLSVSGGVSFITSEVIDLNNQRYSWQPGTIYQLSYSYIFSSGYGLGFVTGRSHTPYEETSLDLVYYGPSFAMAGRFGQRWQGNLSISIGGAHVKFNPGDQSWGVAFNSTVGIEYLLSRHWGLAVDLNAFSVNLGKDETGTFERKGVARLSLMAGVAFHL